VTDGGAETGSSDGGHAPEAGDEAGADAGVEAGCVNLTVNNYASWCSISVAGGTSTAAASQSVCVPPGTVTLVATPASMYFEIGPAPWHLTSGDTGSGDPGTQVGTGTSETSTTTVVLTSGSKCVWACCPFTSGTGCSGVPDPCP
jgi:hypothetical protein